jgi:hypothetical protein
MHPSGARSPLASLSHKHSHKHKIMCWPALAIAIGSAAMGLGATINPPVLAQTQLAPLSQAPMPRTITVTGQCTEKIPATLSN